MKIGDKIPYYDPTSRTQVEAQITAIRDDGTVDILYPHPIVPGVMTTAESYPVGGTRKDDIAEALPVGVGSDGLMTVKRTVKKDAA